VCFFSRVPVSTPVTSKCTLLPARARAQEVVLQMGGKTISEVNEKVTSRAPFFLSLQETTGQALAIKKYRYEQNTQKYRIILCESMANMQYTMV
jgi:hypothetical protein